jgi:hypothetical protein
MMASKQAPERDEIEALLPWHAAGTLSRNDAERVERALATDHELARRFELVREELAETIHLNESLGAPSSRVMEQLLAKIDAEGPVARQMNVRAVSAGIATRISEFITSLSPRTLAWSTSAAAVALLLQAGVITTVLVNDGSGVYRTASESDGPIYRDVDGRPVDDGAQAWVRFAPNATATEITKFLESNKVAIIGGPGPEGLYRIRVAAKGLPKEELARIAQRLQDGKTVTFAAPAN